MNASAEFIGRHRSTVDKLLHAVEDFTPSEAAALGQALEKLERNRAKTRQLENLKKGDSHNCDSHNVAKTSEIPRSGKFPERGNEKMEKGQSRDKIGAAVGIVTPIASLPAVPTAAAGADA